MKEELLKLGFEQDSDWRNYHLFRRYFPQNDEFIAILVYDDIVHEFGLVINDWDIPINPRNFDDLRLLINCLVK